ncbi:glycosyltransferase [Glycomyces sp. NPDC047010]|uniref:glycosyltransferase family protein n=1 Tax=Glycomyces sp. NPDC047010 TaxID=3155023 RepID=UPI003407A84B
MNPRSIARRLRKRWPWALLALLPALPLAAVFAPEPGRAYAALLFGAVVFALVLAVSGLRTAADRARDLALRPAPAAPAAQKYSGPISNRKQQAYVRWTGRLHNGWSDAALPVLYQTARTKGEDPRYRLKVLRALCEWHAQDRRDRHEPRDLDFDVVIVSNMNLPGGTTSSNEAEILAFREAGLRVGLLHHPVWNWNIIRPINPKLDALVDGERVVRLTSADTARCRLMIVRLPNTMIRLMDDLPDLHADRAILVINQTPHEEYGVAGGYGRSWSIADVHRNLTAWVGDHTWYGISPVVQGILERHHAEELAEVDVAAEPWYNTIDMRLWDRGDELPAFGDRPIRIGRHSRDHITKWPNAAEQMRAAYPLRDDIEVHVMGGHGSVQRIIGTLPENWVSHPFGSMHASEFLRGLDVYVYFTDESYVEAFGRSPLEAMAAGVPCLLPERFRPLFGDGAVYCRPDEVEAEVRRLAADPGYYRSRVEAGRRTVRERFSPQALLRRLAGYGVHADPAVFDAPLAPAATTDEPATPRTAA